MKDNFSLKISEIKVPKEIRSAIEDGSYENYSETVKKYYLKGLLKILAGFVLVVFVINISPIQGFINKINFSVQLLILLISVGFSLAVLYKNRPFGYSLFKRKDEQISSYKERELSKKRNEFLIEKNRANMSLLKNYNDHFRTLLYIRNILTPFGVDNFFLRFLETNYSSVNHKIKYVSPGFYLLTDPDDNIYRILYFHEFLSRPNRHTIEKVVKSKLAKKFDVVQFISGLTPSDSSLEIFERYGIKFLALETFVAETFANSCIHNYLSQFLCSEKQPLDMVLSSIVKQITHELLCILESIEDELEDHYLSRSHENLKTVYSNIFDAIAIKKEYLGNIKLSTLDLQDSSNYPWMFDKPQLDDSMYNYRLSRFH